MNIKHPSPYFPFRDFSKLKICHGFRILAVITTFPCPAGLILPEMKLTEELCKTSQSRSKSKAESSSAGAAQPLKVTDHCLGTKQISGPQFGIHKHVHLFIAGFQTFRAAKSGDYHSSPQLTFHQLPIDCPNVYSWLGVTVELSSGRPRVTNFRSVMFQMALSVKSLI